MAQNAGLSGKTLLELIRLVGQKESEPLVAKQALAVLYERYAKDIYAYCVNRWGHWIRDPDSLTEMVDEAFLAFFESATTFNFSGVKDAEHLHRRFRLYLAKRAGWALKDKHRGDADWAETILLGPSDLDTSSGHSVKEPKASYSQLLKLDAVFYRLSEKERDVIRTCIQYYDKDERRFYVPPEIQLALCKTWGFSEWNSLVKCRTRAIAKLRSEIADVANVAYQGMVS